jgi:hypothetical protein
MKKEIEFLTKVDTGDFDRAVEQMQKKLKEIYRPADNAAQQKATAQRLEGMGLGGNLSKPASDAFQKSINQTKVAMDRFISDQSKGLQDAAKLIAKEDDKLKQLRTTQQGLNKDTKEYLDIQKQIQNQQANLAKQREQLAGGYKALNQGIDTRQGMDTPPTKPSFMGALKSARQGQWGQAASQAGGAIGGMGGGIGGGLSMGGIAGGGFTIAEAAEKYFGYKQRLEEAKGSAIQGTFGQDLQRVYAGKSPFESAFMPERKAAEGMAKEKEDKNKTTDFMKGLAATAMIAAGAGLSTTGIGAIAGVPMMVAGGAYLATNDRARLGTFQDQGKEYKELLAKERAKDFRSNLENLKNEDPKKRLALESYEQNYQQDLDIQRQLGMGDRELRAGGGFQYRAHQAGFLTEQANQMAGGIVGAGGSARMGKNAEFGLQMQRAGLTNAPQILGAVSGGVQDVASTKRATISIMAEAFQIGMDNTDFAEENRRFTQSVANVIGRTGAESPGDQDRIAKLMGQFVGERTNKGVEAANSAYEAFQQRGSQTSGRRGAIRMADAINDPALSKLDTSEINELLAAKPEQLKTTDPMIMAYAQKAGISSEQLLGKLQTGRDKSRFLVPGRADKAKEYSKDINSYLAKTGMTYADFAEKANKGGEGLGGDEDARKAMDSFGMLKGLVSMENPEGYNEKNITAQAGEMVTGTPAKSLEDQKADQQKKLEDVGDKLGDAVNMAAAQGQDEARKGLNEMAPAIKAAADAANLFTTAISKAAGAIGAGAPGYLSNLPQGSGTNQDFTSRFTNDLMPDFLQVQGSKEQK